MANQHREVTSVGRDDSLQRRPRETISARGNIKYSGQFDPSVLDQIAAQATRDTYGAVVYQEQIMVMLRQMGFTWNEADTWVKSLKDNVKTLALAVDEVRGKPVFRKFAQKLVDDYGASEDDAWAFTRKFTQYVFNKSHAIGYALIAYWQMWLRVYYPLEFWCSLLDVEPFEVRREAYKVAAARDGVLFLPPHVNGTAKNSIESNAIRLGLAQVKHVGERAADIIEQLRPYSSLEDFEARVPRRTCNARVREVLRAHGALEFNYDVLVAHGVSLNQMLRNSTVDVGVYSRTGKERQ